MLWGLVCILGIFMIGLLWYSPVVMHIKFTRISGDDEGKITVFYLFGLIRINRSLSAVKTRITPKGPQVAIQHGSDEGTPHQHKIITGNDVYGFLTHLRGLIRLAKRSMPILHRFWRKVHIHDFQLTLTFGTGDAVSTGMAVGAMWGVVSYIIGAISNRVQFAATPRIEITPSYYQPMLQISFESIIKVRAGYAISAALRLLRVWKRRTSDGTPNSGSDADGNGEHSGNGRREHDYRRSG